MHFRKLLFASMTIVGLLLANDLRDAVAADEGKPEATMPTIKTPAADGTTTDTLEQPAKKLTETTEALKKLNEEKSGAEKELAKIKAETKKVQDDEKLRKLQEFAGLHFGVGVSYTQTFGKDRINTARIVNGTVRIDDERNSIPRVMLESHYFFDQPGEFHILGLDMLGIKGTEHKWGVGPYVALQPGTNQIIEAMSAGIMWGFKYSQNDPADTRSWNFGIGVSVEPSSKTLGDGFVKNQAAPAGETEIRYQNRTLVGVTALLSFGW